MIVSNISQKCIHLALRNQRGFRSQQFAWVCCPMKLTFLESYRCSMAADVETNAKRRVEGSQPKKAVNAIVRTMTFAPDWWLMQDLQLSRVPIGSDLMHLSIRAQSCTWEELLGGHTRNQQSARQKPTRSFGIPGTTMGNRSTPSGWRSTSAKDPVQPGD
jgi:hypothetical protein